MTSGAVDLRVLWSLLRGVPKHGSQAERLQAFYGPQAAHYDSFRERLLAGRRELVGMMVLPDRARVVELGGGTGQNLDFFGDRIERMESVEVVDLCPALLERARRRTAGMANVRVVEADATTYRPPEPVDCVYLSYALTMMPDWQAVVGNALRMLRPGGILGVVDFYVSRAAPAADDVRHGFFTRQFWPRWFAHDGVHLNPEHLALLRERLPDHSLHEFRAPVPYMPGLRVPYYLFVGRCEG